MSGSTRRSFIQGSAAATAALSGGWPSVLRGSDDRVVRLGFIGVGGRGTHLLKLSPGPEGHPGERGLRPPSRVREPGGGPWCGSREATIPASMPGKTMTSTIFWSVTTWNAVVVATPWRWHTPMSVAAMKAGQSGGRRGAGGRDLAGVLGSGQHLRSHEKALHDAGERLLPAGRDGGSEDGPGGDSSESSSIASAAYQHDLRHVKFNPGAKFGPGSRGEANWRTQHSIQRNGDVYPTHGAGPMANCLDIDRGNRFVTLTSTATKARGLHDYIVRKGGADHPNAKIQWALGDVVTSVIKCARGETLLVSHDTNLPRPYSLNFRVQGTRGIWMSDNKSIYIEDLSPEEHRWEPFEKYQREHDHALWKRFGEEAAGAGHGGMDFFVVNGFMEALKTGPAHSHRRLRVGLLERHWSAVRALHRPGQRTGVLSRLHPGTMGRVRTDLRPE